MIPSFRIYIVLRKNAGAEPPVLIARSRWVNSGYTKLRVWGLTEYAREFAWPQRLVYYN